MADHSITRAMGRFADHVPDGADSCFSHDGDRAYLFNREGDVVTTRRRDGENDDTLCFRLRAALLSISVREDG